MADAGYFVWLVFIACAREISPSSHLLSIFLLVRARVLEISPLAPKNPAPATNANLSYTQVRIHKPALGKVWGLAMLSSNEERGTGTSTANWKIKNGNKTNPNHYPFSVFVPFFYFFYFSVPGRRSFPFSVIPRNITPLELRWFTFKQNLPKLQLVQNFAARLVTNTKKFDHVTPVLRELRWPSVKS